MNPSPGQDWAALLAQADWVRDLARRLTADAHVADDLAQDALAAALVRPPPEDRPLRAWLAGVLRNLVRQERRSTAHRRTREARAARAEGVASGSELLERLDSHRALVEAVAALAEPYRSVILLRYFEGLSPAAIARRTGTPLRTVHTRLSRALARLRSELDRAHGGDRQAWLQAFLPYARGASGSGPWSSAATGALVMHAKLKLCVAALAAVGICTLVPWRELVRRGEARPVSGHEPPVLARTEPAEQPPEQALDQAPVPAVRSAVVSASAAPELPAEALPVPLPRIAGRVLDADDAAVAGIRVRVTPSRGADGSLEAITDVRGAFELAWSGGSGTLDVASPGWTAFFRPTLWEERPDRELVLVVARSITLAGTVVDEHRRAVGSARIAVPLPFRLRARFEAVLDDASTVEPTVTTDAEGRFELAGVPALPDMELLTTRAGFLEDRRPLPAYDDLALEIELARVPEGPEHLQGRVVDQLGAPVEGAWVGLGQSTTKSGANGEFALQMEVAREAGVLRAVRTGYLPAEIALAPGEPWPEPLLLTLGPPPLFIRGRVVDARGTPVPTAQVWTDEETSFGAIELEGGEMSVRVGASIEGLLRDDPWTHRIPTDVEGRFVLTGLLPRGYRLRAFDPRRLVFTTENVAAGAQEVVLRLPDEALLERVAGVVTDLAGEPIVGAFVELEREALGGGPAGRLGSPPARTAENGSFAFEQVSRSVSAIRVSGMELEFHRTLGAQDDLGSLEIRVPLQAHVQIDAGESSDADQAVLLDERGERLSLTVQHGQHMYVMDAIELDHGRSEAFSASQVATELALLSGGVELRRLPIRLVRGELNVLRP